MDRIPAAARAYQVSAADLPRDGLTVHGVAHFFARPGANFPPVVALHQPSGERRRTLVNVIRRHRENLT